MRFRYVINIEVNRTQGKMASRDDISSELISNFDDPGSVTAGEAEYDVTSFDINEEDELDPVAALALHHGVDRKTLKRRITKLVKELRKEQLG